MSVEYRLGLTGWPLSDSLSPQLHTAALRALGLRGSYQLFPLEDRRGSRARLFALLERLRQGELHGLNVTIPYKEMVFAGLRRTTPAAAAIGAVNTLFVEDGVLIGDNTDAPGFLADLQIGFDLRPGMALVLGAGGAARAVSYALAGSGWQLLVAARRPAQAEYLLEDLAIEGEALALEGRALAPRLAACSLIVNTTPPGATPWPAYLDFPAQTALYDLSYAPQGTTLMTAARAAGGEVRSGIGMLVEQAARSFARWTGAPLPLASMRAALEGSSP